MPALGTYIPANVQAHIGANVNGGWPAFPVATNVVTSNVAGPQVKRSGNNVEIRVPQNWLANTHPDEVRDTLIFEGINVINEPLLNAAQTNFRTNGQTLAVYGRAYSDIEADTAWRTGQILLAMQGAGIVLSAWGAGIANSIGGMNLAAYTQHFATTPQDPAAQDQRQLPSEDLYQFEWASRTPSSVVAAKIMQWTTTGAFQALGPAQRESRLQTIRSAVRQRTDALDHLNQGSKGRADKYNDILDALAQDDARLHNRTAILAGAAYHTPVY